MIVVDTSAVVVIFRQEEEAARCAALIATDEAPLISAASLVEASIVLRGLKRISAQRAEDDFISTAGIHIEPVSSEQSRVARAAHMRFGKGTGHGAGLDYGDCFAYALAKGLGSALLCTGTDFAKTDIEVA